VDTTDSPKTAGNPPVPISDTDPGREPGAPSADPSVETKPTDSKQQPDITGNGVTGHATTLLDLLWLGGTDPTHPDRPS
jgi:hypothetical protein